jgi:hypothetical protein
VTPTPTPTVELTTVSPTSPVGLIVLVPLILLLAVFLWRSLLTTYLVLTNYRYPRAIRCNANECAFFQHDPNDAKSAACLNPLGRLGFEARRLGGDQKGCGYSVQVREIEGERKPASLYLTEYLQVRQAFEAHTNLWLLITLLGVAFVLIVGILTLSDAVKLLL